MRGRLGFPAGRTIVLYVGRLSRAKGVMMLIEAWPDLIVKHPDAYLVMVGSGSDSWDDCEGEIVEYVREHALEAHIAMVGHSNSVHEYLQGADLFVTPSDYEGFSLTLVEALGAPSRWSRPRSAPRPRSFKRVSTASCARPRTRRH